MPRAEYIPSCEIVKVPDHHKYCLQGSSTWPALAGFDQPCAGMLSLRHGLSLLKPTLALCGGESPEGPWDMQLWCR